MGIVRRATLLTARTSTMATGAGTVIASIDNIEGYSLSVAKALFFNMKITQAPVGAGILAVTIQRPFVPNPDVANDAHWEDLYRFSNIVAASPLANTIVNIGYPVDEAPWSWTRTEAKSGATIITANTGRTGGAGYIRIIERLYTAVFTTPAIYDLHMWTN